MLEFCYNLLLVFVSCVFTLVLFSSLPETWTVTVSRAEAAWPAAGPG